MTQDKANIPASGQPDAAKPPRLFGRRGFILGGVGVCIAGAVAAGRWFNVSATVGNGALSAPDAHAQAIAGSITLIDIRRPDEWARTGVPEGGVPLDMRRDDFIDALLVQVNNATDAPIALICARGVRSRRMSTRLQQAGFTTIIDVPEGMLGSGAGPGWVKRGLPVVDA